MTKHQSNVEIYQVLMQSSEQRHIRANKRPVYASVGRKTSVK